MPRKKSGMSPELQYAYEAPDRMFMDILAEYIVNIRESGLPDSAVREEVARDTLRRLAVHGREQIDAKIEEELKRREMQRDGH